MTYTAILEQIEKMEQQYQSSRGIEQDKCFEKLAILNEKMDYMIKRERKQIMGIPHNEKCMKYKKTNRKLKAR